MPRSKEEWLDLAVARHEACHAIVALKLGLPVKWVTIEAGHDEGQDYGAAVKISDEGIDMSNPGQAKAVCLAQMAPSYLFTGDARLDAYARVECGTAMQMADHHGLESDLLDMEASELVEDHKEEILLLAERLVAEGTVSFDEEARVA